ncbi:MAG: CRISPR-associated helicase Cas3' [Pirellulaceae bacterium]|nr:CRISPR-associated helicase Cas3' [Pirellulaceae bacterium]
MSFRDFFHNATGNDPYPYQKRLGEEIDFPQTLEVPTGVGKTAATLLAWLYRRREHTNSAVRKATPRRLVYCLPMRTLVEQTYTAVNQWLTNLNCNDKNPKGVSTHLLMGGEERTDWDIHPDKEAILIGTQDMLLSRALNRGYGMSRYRWPVHFALLNNDALWIIDETQLMGVGLTTTVQLQGLRQKLNTYGTTQTLWMSATLDDTSLKTFDHKPEEGFLSHRLNDDDHANEQIARRVQATKDCKQANTTFDGENKANYPKTLAEEVLEAHQPGTITLVILNNVKRAQETYTALEKQLAKNEGSPERFLIHSRYRPGDRQTQQENALNEDRLDKNGPGRIIVATQAIEAGVDLSATTLFTELAQWSSMVQRFGRCNRRGECGQEGNPDATVYWIDFTEENEKRQESLALPYDPVQLDHSRNYLKELSGKGVGLEALATIDHQERQPIRHTLRRKDLLDLWETTPDLSGNDIDVSRYIRDSKETDIQVYWRIWDDPQEGRPSPPIQGSEKDSHFAPPCRDELCSVSLEAAKAFIKSINGAQKDKRDSKLRAWRWDPLENAWDKVQEYEILPGMTILLHSDIGGYELAIGWTGDSKTKSSVQPVEQEEKSEQSFEAMDQDETKGQGKMTITKHLQDAQKAAQNLERSLNSTDVAIPWEAVVTAAHWHDVGKAHAAFQNAIYSTLAEENQYGHDSPLLAKSGGRGRLIFKAPTGKSLTNKPLAEGKETLSKRCGFRHELASALAWLDQNDERPYTDLIAFLLAAHHGKVRESIRSMPNENRPHTETRRFTRGIWDGDIIPSVDLGDWTSTKEVCVDLSLMEMGEQNRTGQKPQASWRTRVLNLLNEYGPFCLSYLESLVRIADWHASTEGEN